MPLHFYLPHQELPTQFNLAFHLQQLGWRKTRFQSRADFSEQHLQFDEHAAQHLEFKHLLAELVARYCPQVMPVTYSINDQNCFSVIDQLAAEYYTEGQAVLDSIAGLVWILKPALLNNGEHIHVFECLSQLKQHYRTTNRLGGEHVLQQYITQPHLLKGHKYSIRMFVVVTNDVGGYLYPHGYFNVAKSAYEPASFADLGPHLTNEHLRPDDVNVIQIPTTRADFFEPIYQQIKSIISATLQGFRQSQPHVFKPLQPSRLAIFGYDFMVDAHQRTWLLEVNHGPCFPTDEQHPLQHHLYHDYWKALITCFVLPIAYQQHLTERSFEPFVAL